jgi:peptide/nickel transport system permease protein
MTRLLRSALSRLALMAVSTWLIVTIAFATISGLPGDTARLVLGRQASTEALSKFRETAGLDLPRWRQYVVFLNNVAHLRLGESLGLHRPVTMVIGERVAVTLRLIGVASALVLILSFVLPLLMRVAGMKRTLSTYSAVFLLFGILPPYVSGVVLLAVFAGVLRWTPAIFDPSRPLEWILPGIVLAAYPVTLILRLLDQQLGHAANAPYALRARAYGIPRVEILLHELLPNALPVTLAGVANGLAGFVTGTFFVEVTFSIPGLGWLTWQAIANRDIPLLAALCMFFAIAISAISALLDLARFGLDPRIRGQHA